MFRFNSPYYLVYATLFFCLLTSQSAFSEVLNKGRGPDWGPECKPYSSFLMGKEAKSDATCFDIQNFLIDNRNAELTLFLKRAGAMFGGETTYEAMINTMFAVIHKDSVLAISWSELAGRRIAIKMAASFDEERAVFYSHLLFDIQRLAILSLCSDEGACKTIQKLGSLGEFFGPQFERLDEKRSDLILLCAIRTDGYGVPIREVLGSRVFENCLGSALIANR